MDNPQQNKTDHTNDALLKCGFSEKEILSLQRISRQLRRWFIKLAGDGETVVYRDEDGKTWCYSQDTPGVTMSVRCKDMETRALARLADIIQGQNLRFVRVSSSYMTPWCAFDIAAGKTGPVQYYVQRDPLGVALYVIRPGDIHKDWVLDRDYKFGIAVH